MRIIDTSLINSRLILWDNTAEEIRKLLIIKDGYFIVKGQCFSINKSKITNRQSKTPYGTIAASHKHQIIIATITYDIAITKISDLNDNNLTFSELQDEFNIKKGDRLTIISNKAKKNIEHLATTIQKHEGFWHDQLIDIKPTINIPNINVSKNRIAAKTLSNLRLFNKKSFINKPYNKDELLTTILIYLYRINNYNAYTIAYSYAFLKNLEPNLKPFFFDNVPLTINLNAHLNFIESLSCTKDKIKQIEENQTYAKDIYTRYPDLSVKQLSNFIQISIVESIKNYKPVGTTKIELVITTKELSLYLYVDRKLTKTHLSHTIIPSMVDHINNLTDTCAKNPKQLINQFIFLTKQQKTALIKWNATEKYYPNSKVITELFEDQTQKTPENIALAFGTTNITYQELNHKANQLAHYLKNLGTKPNMLVAICLERHPNVIISILAILKAGAAYVPIDPTYPQSRINFMLKDCDAAILITHKKIYNALQLDGSAKLIFLDQHQKIISKESDKNLMPIAKANNLAYVIYTSGSTGIPKGAQITHQNVINMALYHIDKLKITPQDSILQFVSISFDVMVADITMALLSGAKLCFPPKNKLTVGPTLIKTIQKNKITTALFPNAVLKILPPKKLPYLKKVVSGGEICIQSLVNQWLHQPRLFINAYGPTETTICATMSICQVNQQNTNIGKPCPNMQIYVLDKYKQIMPIGTIGELYIGGVGVALGYLNRPDLTKEKFITNPFNKTNNKLYKTGDMGMWLPNGNVQYIGRIDNQIKIRGFRVELEEINTHLQKHSNINQSAVIVKEDNNNKNIAAYFTCFDKTKNNVTIYKDFLKTFLPEHMIPTNFCALDTLPLTQNGKIDKEALLKLKTNSQRYSYVAPITENELTLTNMWSKILGIKVDKISVYNGFFEIGGDSLTAARLILLLNTNFQVNITLNDLFKFSTISALARKINMVNSSKASSLISPAKIRGQYPLSFSQELVYMHQQLVPSHIIYNEPAIVHINNNLNITVLEKTLNEIIKRHEVLRTNIININGEPRQIISPFKHFKLPYFDLRESSISKNKIKAFTIARNDLKRPFNIEKDPLIHFTLTKLATNSYKLFITLHHLIFDGITISNLFMHELDVLYKAFLQKKPILLASPTLQYGDYCVWQKKHPLIKNTHKHVIYWKKQLEGLQPLPFPIKPIVTKNITSKGKLQILNIPNTLTKKIEKLSRKEGVTLFMTLFAVFNVLLYRYTNQKDIAIGTVVAGRDHIDIEKMMGNFLNTIILRNQLSEEINFWQLLQNIRTTTINAYSHRELHFRQLLEILQIQGKSREALPFQVAFIFEPKISKTSLGWTLTQLETHSNTAKFNLMFELDHRPTGIIGRVEYNTDIFENIFIKRMIKHYLILLKNITKNVNYPINKIPMLTIEEKRQILINWNRTQVIYSKKPINKLFEEQTQKTPENIALAFGTTNITYQELNHKANQLARYLKNLGTKPNMLIATCLERHPNVIISILAILKAGAAYVPIDPTYPQSRINFMLKDCDAAILITHKKIYDDLQLDCSAKLIFLDQQQKIISKESDKNLMPIAKANNLAYVIYTSGSTGKPKGILLKHKTITNLIHWQAMQKLNRCFNVAQFANYSFDVSLQEIFYTLLYGHKLDIVPPNIKESTHKIANFLKTRKINILFLPTSLLNLLAYEIITNNILLPNIQEIIVAGEALKITDNIRVFFEKNSHIKLNNHYGPSETHVVTAYTLSQQPKNWPTLPPIGKPIANTKIYILDKSMSPTPINIVGEIYIGGVMLAHSYLKQDSLTKEKFIKNPFNSATKDRLYRTGDLGYWLSDGNIAYVNRYDNQIKIRGFRIEINEIEHNLQQHKLIQQCAVFGDRDNNRLIAYVMQKKKSRLDTNKLHTFLIQKLPKYMIPDLFVFLDKIPLNNNGKIDKESLPKPKYCENKHKKHCQPKTAEEKKLTKIWSKILNIAFSKISIHDNFFEIGGHSLISLQLLSQIKTSFRANLELHDIFKAPTIAELSKIIFRKISNIVTNNVNLILLKQGHNKKNPLFLIHPIGGTVFWYQTLVKHLNTDCAIYAIQDPGIAAQDKLFNSIQEMASSYLKLIKSIQKHGNYLLGGASFGGTVAVEIAQQLKQQGESIQSLILFDSWATYPEDIKDKKYFENGLKKMHSILLEKSAMKNLDDIDSWIELQWHRVQLLWNYQIPYFADNVVLFKAKNPLPYFEKLENATNYWQNYSSAGIKTHIVPGDHETMFQQTNVKPLAKKLDTYLNMSNHD